MNCAAQDFEKRAQENLRSEALKTYLRGNFSAGSAIDRRETGQHEKETRAEANRVNEMAGGSR